MKEQVMNPKTMKELFGDMWPLFVRSQTPVTTSGVSTTDESYTPSTTTYLPFQTYPNSGGTTTALGELTGSGGSGGVSTITYRLAQMNQVPTISVYRREDGITEFDRDRPHLPERKTTEAYCYDICAFLPPTQQELALPPLTTVRVPTGLVLALPEHWAVLVCSRSGLAAQGVQVINAPGVIDADYRDEVSVLLSYIAPPDSPPFIITHGMRIAQLLFLPPTPYLAMLDVPTREALPVRETTRTGGFGSTGV